MSTKFTPTPAEHALVSQIFNQADPQKIGILTGDVAVKVFGGAKLQPSVLGEIWSIADEDNNGWLPRKGVAIALRLMGWAQKGEKITSDLVHKSGPLPTIEGYTAVSQQATGTPPGKSPPPGLPPFTPQEKAKFLHIFTKAGPESNGLLSGNKARDIFVKSKLSNDMLLQIWNLADTQDRGALDSTDFAIGMYFIQALMSGQLTFVPTTLPPGLYQQAGGTAFANQGSVRSHMTGNSGSFSPLSTAFPSSRSALQPQYTGQSQLLQPDHTGFSTSSPKPPILPARPPTSGLVSPPFIPQRNGHAFEWDVTSSEKAASDNFFDELDPRRRGYIEGEVAVPFMLKSNLPEEDLARVWDLSDINHDGKLSRDGFAIAMYLIQRKLAGSEIPNALPPTLLPPSMRGSTVASPFSSPPRQQPLPPQEPVRDLLWDDTPPASATVSQSARSSEPPTTALASATSPPVRDPFGSSAFNPPPSNRDLLSDDDDVAHTSPPLHDRSAEIGNTQNQLHSTSRALDTLKSEASQVDERLANQTSQLSALQTQLATARAAYETETKALAALRERYSAQTTEWQKTKEELIRAESDLSAVRVEKAEIEGAFMRDREDTRELQRKMTEVGQQVEATKIEVEKARKDAKQQKGLLAIAKKQLSSKEAERAKAEKELEEAAMEAASVTKERTDAETELEALATSLAPARTDLVSFAAAHSLPSSPDPSSPVGSVATSKSNNPFDKLAKSDGTPRSQSPFLPFSGGPLPTPSTGATTSTSDAASRASFYDPFGFSETFEAQTIPINGIVTAVEPVDAFEITTPKPTPVDILAANAPQPVLSPGTEEESDHFVTPPTTATPHSLTPSPAHANLMIDATESLVIDDVTSKFPDLSTQDSKPGPVVLSTTEAQTDLTSKLQELDIDEPDSDSDDEVPLADLATKSRTLVKQSPIVPPQIVPTKSETPSFDDVFGVAPPPANAAPAQEDTLNDATNSVQPSLAPVVGGVSAFDEAMGTIPSSAAPSQQTFVFDSAFEDNFDFESAASDTFPPVPTNPPNGNDAQSFDNIFVTPTKTNIPVFLPPLGPPPSATNGHAVESLPAVEVAKATFDEAFSGFDSGPSLNLDNNFISTTKQPITSQPSPLVAASPTSSTITPPSPQRAVVPSSKPTSPITRAKSPPPRSSSPKPPRPSTSSSKETHEKVKEPPRHSKLSIRLPFGKKKKQQQQQLEPLPAAPGRQLSSTQEETSKTATSAVDDDVEAVKQLTAMGFSRSDSISALERYGYDVQRALNSLLGAP